MSSPLVSVLTTAYNREKYIAECIESVLASTFQDYEYIIVDDCSTDKSHEIALAYAKRDSRIRVYRNERNIGQFPNRNRAAELAVGKYIKYADSDDVWYRHLLQVMVYYMQQFPGAGIGMCEHPRGVAPFPIYLDPVAAWRQALLGPGLLRRAPGSTIIRNDAFRECGGFRFPDAFSGDYLFLYDICARYPAVLFPAGLGFYRVHSGQELAKLTPDQNVAEQAKYLPQIILSDKCPLAGEEQRLAYRNVVGPFTRYCFRLVLRGRFVRAVRLWSFAGRPLKDLLLLARRPRRPYPPCF